MLFCSNSSTMYCPTGNGKWLHQRRGNNSQLFVRQRQRGPSSWSVSKSYANQIIQASIQQNLAMPQPSQIEYLPRNSWFWPVDLKNAFHLWHWQMALRSRRKQTEYENLKAPSRSVAPLNLLNGEFCQVYENLKPFPRVLADR